MGQVKLDNGEYAERVVLYTAPGGDGGTNDPINSSNPLPTTGGGGKGANATFTPAASSHAAGDCVGAAAEFALGAPSGCVFMITDANLVISSSNAMATAWRLHLYNVTPPSALADDAAWDLPSGDRSSYLGFIDLGTAVDVGSTQYIQNAFVNRAVQLTGTSVFGYLVNLTTLTTEAVAHQVRLRGFPL